MEHKITGIIPARSGSLRVPNKNQILVGGHPLIAYSIISANNSGLFSRLIVASDSDEICDIGHYYGATEIIKRDPSDASSTSIDIDWLTNLHNLGKLNQEFFAILRPTSPLRSVGLMKDCVQKFVSSDFDSLRTIKQVNEHPGKMWRFEESHEITPYLQQDADSPATHALQYQSLENLYVQTSVFEIARTPVIPKTRTREGKSILGYITTGPDSHSVDTIDDLDYLKYISITKPDLLPQIDISPYERKSDHKYSI